MKLETKRLIIRDPIIDDFKFIWEMRNDPEVCQFTGGVTSFSKDELYQNHLKSVKIIVTHLRSIQLF